jgi:hypothetical protein
MNIQQIQNTDFNNGDAIKLVNVISSTHTDYVPYNNTEMNKFLYDIMVPELPEEIDLGYEIKMHCEQKTCNKIVYVKYPETEEDNLRRYADIFEGFSPEEINRYKLLQRQTVHEVSQNYENMPLVISVTKRLHYKVLDTMRKEKYFNRLVKIAQKTWTVSTPRPTTGETTSCALFSTAFDEVPSLYHTIIKFLHRNLQRSNMVSMTRAQVCSCDHTDAMNALNLPFLMHMELFSLHLSCDFHQAQSILPCNKLDPKRFFIRKGSKLEELARNSDFNDKQSLFGRWEIRHIKMQVFNRYYNSHYTEEEENIMKDGISEVEIYL